LKEERKRLVKHQENRRACACGEHYGAEAWNGLSLLTRLSADEVSRYATPWPSHVDVEVRVCAKCGRKISRLVERAMNIARRAA
jgi:hypothetical protein